MNSHNKSKNSKQKDKKAINKKQRLDGIIDNIKTKKLKKIKFKK